MPQAQPLRRVLAAQQPVAASAASGAPLSRGAGRRENKVATLTAQEVQ
jgi:hypothetical protein